MNQLQPSPAPPGPVLTKKIHALGLTQDKKYIPAADRSWFWKTFRQLRDQGKNYPQAWDWTTWALAYHYGLDSLTLYEKEQAGDMSLDPPLKRSTT